MPEYFKLDSGLLGAMARPPTPHTVKDSTGAFTSGIQRGVDLGMQFQANARANNVDRRREEIAARAQEEYEYGVSRRDEEELAFEEAEERKRQEEERKKQEEERKKSEETRKQSRHAGQLEYDRLRNDKLKAEIAELDTNRRIQEGIDKTKVSSSSIKQDTLIAMKKAERNPEQALQIGLKALDRKSELTTDDWKEIMEALPDATSPEKKATRDAILRLHAVTDARAGNSQGAVNVFSHTLGIDGGRIHDIRSKFPEKDMIDDVLVVRILPDGGKIKPGQEKYYGDGVFAIQEYDVRDIANVAGNDGRIMVEAASQKMRNEAANQRTERAAATKLAYTKREEEMKARYARSKLATKAIGEKDEKEVAEVIARDAPVLAEKLATLNSASASFRSIIRATRLYNLEEGYTYDAAMARAIVEEHNKHGLIVEPSWYEAMMGREPTVNREADAPPAEAPRPAGAGPIVPKQTGQASRNNNRRPKEGDTQTKIHPTSGEEVTIVFTNGQWVVE